MLKNKLWNGLPVFNALVDSEDTGVFKVSLVTDPATEVDFVYFDKDKQVEKFSIANEQEHIVAGVIMLADTPIFRVTKDGFQYYINYTKDTLKIMAEKMIFDGVGSAVNIQHTDGTDVNGVNLQQLFVIDRDKGINPSFFSEVPDGSLIGYYKVNNQDVWDMIEKGDVLSFSLEGIFDLQEQIEEFKKENVNDEEQTVEEILSLIEKIKNKIQ